MNKKAKILISILGLGSGIASNIVFLAASIIASLNNDMIMINFPFKEWIIEIPLAIIGIACLIFMTNKTIDYLVEENH